MPKPHELSVQPFLPFEIPERSNIRKRKCISIFILIPHRSQRKAPVLHRQPATVPVVTSLHRCVLQRSKVRVKAKAGGGTQAALVQLPVAQQHPKLVEFAAACRSRPESTVR